MKLPDLTRPYPGWLQETNEFVDRVEAGYDIISEPTRIANTRFVDTLYITAQVWR